MGNTWEPRDFSTFSAKAIAGIGNRLPDTVKDRAVPIALKRKLRSEGVERFLEIRVSTHSGLTSRRGPSGESRD